MIKRKIVLVFVLILVLAGTGTVRAHSEDGIHDTSEESRIGRTDNLVLFFHILGIVLGLGGATVSDIFFFKFARDRRISEKEVKKLHLFSKIIWVGLAVLILSGLGLYLSHGDDLLKSPKFLTKMSVVGVIIVNGILLNILISPKLTKIFSLLRRRRLAFALGSISIVSWYSAFILGLLRSVPGTFWQLLSIYLILLAVAVAGSQAAERGLMRKAGRSSSQ